MFVSADTMQVLYDSGLPAEKVMEILRAFERDQDAIAKPRSDNAERQRRYRARKAESVTNNVTCNAESNAQGSPSPALPPGPPNPPPSTPGYTTGARAVLPFARPNGFARFWEAYPSKVGKRNAESAYERALKRLAGPDPPSTILAAVEAQKGWRRWREGYVPNPQTWLNRDGWDDQPETEKPDGRPDPKPSDAFARKQANLARAYAASQRVPAAE